MTKKKSPFRNPLSEFVCMRTYSRFMPDKGRRETWSEIVDRYVDYIKTLVPNDGIDFKAIRKAIFNLEVLPSMRALWSAGDCARKTNETIYNCSYIAINNIRSVPEALKVLMCGAGVGFSVEKVHTEKLPVVPNVRTSAFNLFKVDDSKEGWQNSVHACIINAYKGLRTKFDYSAVRPEGSILKTMGGRASGPGPLKEIHDFIMNTFDGARGRKLKPVEWLEIMCMVAQAVVVGGVRRSALICLSDLDDNEIATIKSGAFWETKPHLSTCNISAVYNEKPSEEEFFREWQRIKDSGTGERGIFSRLSVRKNLSERRLMNEEILGVDLYGTNPCAEINLRDMQFCNLSEVIIRSNDTYDTVAKKVELATIIGTIQSTVVDFKNMRPEWKLNCEQERLLGVSLTGQVDNIALMTKENLEGWRFRAQSINSTYAALLGINESAAITCVKPSGTASIVADAATGAHLRWSRYYIRRIQISSNDPLLKLAVDAGVPAEPYSLSPEKMWVLSFPVKSPDNAPVRKDWSGMDQVQYWLKLKENWTDHNPSITIYLEAQEWDEVGRFLYDNFDRIGGLSFFPKDETIYLQAPFEEITEEQYYEMLSKFPEIDYSKLTDYEQTDYTSGSKEFACVSGQCEI